MNVQVGTTDTACLDLDQDVVWTKLGQVHGDDSILLRLRVPVGKGQFVVLPGLVSSFPTMHVWSFKECGVLPQSLHLLRKFSHLISVVSVFLLVFCVGVLV